MLPIIVPFIMPKYTEAVPVMCLMMLVLVFIIMELPYYLLVAMGKILQQNIAVYIGLGCFVIFALGALQFNMGLIGVVGASLLGRMIKILIIYIFIYNSRNMQSVF